MSMHRRRHHDLALEALDLGSSVWTGGHGPTSTVYFRPLKRTMSLVIVTRNERELFYST